MSGCEKYAELMNRYLDGDLPASQISDLLDHLETCASCRNRFDALKIMAFEMRHMQTDPPSALHGQIMQAVQRSNQRRPRAYLKTAFAIAACAAVMALAVNGNFFQIADNYLFANKSVSTETSTETSAETSADQADGAAPAQAPVQSPAGAMGNSPAQTNESGLAPPEADAPSESEVSVRLPAMDDGLPELAGDENAAEDPMLLDEAAPAEKASASLSSAGAQESGRGRQAQQSDDLKTEAAKRSGSDSDADSDQPFRVPPLDTDEVFAFYCVALGQGSIPNAVDQNEIVRFPDKNCLYIYVQTTQFTKKGCENLLSQSGFAIREGANLPETDESMPYGLIVIYGYEMD